MTYLIEKSMLPPILVGQEPSYPPESISREEIVATPRTGRIRVSSGFSTATDEVLVPRGLAVVKGMTGNPAFTRPPIEIAVLGELMEEYQAALVAVLDGGRKAIAARNHLREEVRHALKALARYVESACHNDVSILLSSGFEQLIVTRSGPEPLSPPAIRSIDQGRTGQLLPKVERSAKAWSYEIRCAVLEPTGVPGPWTSQSATTVVSRLSFDGLTPGKIYVFQARVLGPLGFSDWSDAVTRMCI